MYVPNGVKRHAVDQQGVLVRDAHGENDRIIGEHLVQLPAGQLIIQNLDQGDRLNRRTIRPAADRAERQTVVKRNPFPGGRFELLHELIDLVQDVLLAANGAPVNDVIAQLIRRNGSFSRILSRAGDVQMRVNQAGNDCPALEVDLLSIRSGLWQHGLVCPHSRDFIACDRDSFCDREVGVHSQDLAVMQDHVSRSGRRLSCCVRNEQSAPQHEHHRTGKNLSQHQGFHAIHLS